MGLDVFLEILRALESFAAELTLVRLQGNMDTNVGGDVVTLDGCGSALTPSARQVEIVGRLAANMSLANMLLHRPLARDPITCKDDDNLHRELPQWVIARRSPAIDTGGSHQQR